MSVEYRSVSRPGQKLLAVACVLGGVAAAVAIPGWGHGLLLCSGKAAQGAWNSSSGSCRCYRCESCGREIRAE